MGCGYDGEPHESTQREHGRVSVAVSAKLRTKQRNTLLQVKERFYGTFRKHGKVKKHITKHKNTAQAAQMQFVSLLFTLLKNIYIKRDVASLFVRHATRRLCVHTHAP